MAQGKQGSMRGYEAAMQGWLAGHRYLCHHYPTRQDIEVVKRLQPVEHDYPTFRIKLVPFVAHVIGGDLLLEEHADCGGIKEKALNSVFCHYLTEDF